LERKGSVVSNTKDVTISIKRSEPSSSFFEANTSLFLDSAQEQQGEDKRKKFQIQIPVNLFKAE